MRLDWRTFWKRDPSEGEAEQATAGFLGSETARYDRDTMPLSSPRELDVETSLHSCAFLKHHLGGWCSREEAPTPRAARLRWERG